MRLEKTAPGAPVVSLDEMKAQMFVDLAFADDNIYIQAITQVSEDYAENITGLALVDAEYTMTLSNAPSCFPLYRYPLLSITSVEVDDVAETEFEIVDEFSRNPQLSVPSGLGKKVKVVFQAGHADPTSVPTPIGHAIKLLASHYYANREPVIVGTIIANVPLAYDALIASYKGL